MGDHPIASVATAATQLLSYWTDLASTANTQASTALIQQSLRPTSSTGAAAGVTLNAVATSSLQYTAGATNTATAAGSEEYSRRMSTGTGPELSQHLSIHQNVNQHYQHQQSSDQARRGSSMSSVPATLSMLGQAAFPHAYSVPCGTFASQQLSDHQQHYESLGLHQQAQHAYAQHQSLHHHDQSQHQNIHLHQWRLPSLSDQDLYGNLATLAEHEHSIADVCQPPAPGHPNTSLSQDAHTMQQQAAQAAEPATAHASTLHNFGGSLDLMLALELGDDDLGWI